MRRSMFMRRSGFDLLRFRESRGLTVAEQSLDFGVLPRSYSRWESGENRVPDYIRRLVELRGGQLYDGPDDLLSLAEGKALYGEWKRARTASAGCITRAPAGVGGPPSADPRGARNA